MSKSKKKIKIKLESNIMILKKAIRIPTVKGGYCFKDKKKYSRKEKHRRKYS